MTKRHKPRALEPTEPADIVRILTARWTLIHLLVQRDPRVRAAWLQWVSTLAAFRFANGLRWATTPDERASVLQRELPNARETIRRALPEFEPDPWVAEWVADYLLSSEYQHETQIGVTIQFNLQESIAHRRNRLPKDSATVSRNTTWFFLTRVLRPAVSVSQLARDYVGAAGRSRTGARSVVQDGIRAAESCLALNWTPLP